MDRDVQGGWPSLSRGGRSGRFLSDSPQRNPPGQHLQGRLLDSRYVRHDISVEAPQLVGLGYCPVRKQDRWEAWEAGILTLLWWVRFYKTPTKLRWELVCLAASLLRADLEKKAAFLTLRVFFQ